MVSFFITIMNLQTVLHLVFLEFYWEFDVWLFVIIKSYVKVNFKWRNNNNDNNNNNNENNNSNNNDEEFSLFSTPNISDTNIRFNFVRLLSLDFFLPNNDY